MASISDTEVLQINLRDNLFFYLLFIFIFSALSVILTLEW